MEAIEELLEMGAAAILFVLAVSFFLIAVRSLDKGIEGVYGLSCIEHAVMQQYE